MGKRFSTEEWKLRCSLVHGDKYDYSLWGKSCKSAEQVQIICHTHGEFTQILDNHYRGKGCPDCGHLNRRTSNTKSKKYHLSLCKRVHGSRYDYSKWPTVVTNAMKVSIICHTHGTFTQSIDCHSRGNGCPKCGRISAKNTMKQRTGFSYGHQPFDIQLKNLLLNKVWVSTQYHKFKSSDKFAESIGVNGQTVLNYIHSHNIDILPSNTSSVGEREIQAFCSRYTSDIKLNTRKIIPPYELDVYIPEYNLAIEYCGLYWHSEQQGKDKLYHKRKYDLCKNQGIQLLTIFEDEWQLRQPQVKNKILSLMNQQLKSVIYARKTKIVEVSISEKQEFFDLNHIQGRGPSSINIGLEYNNKLVACCGLIKQSNGRYYLNRYATANPVVGGFSKLVKYFCDNYEWKQLISFADCRWSTGNLYTVTGWIYDNVIPPDYSYCPPGGKVRHHKFNYRHSQLPNRLKTYDPLLTESQNCDNNGYLRIWDCGKHRYIINNPNYGGEVK